MDPNEAKRQNLDVRRETPPFMAEAMNRANAENPEGRAAMEGRENKVLPVEKYPGQFEQGTASGGQVDKPTNAGNARPEDDSLPQGGKGAPKALNEPDQQDKEDPGQNDATRVGGLGKGSDVRSATPSPAAAPKGQGTSASGDRTSDNQAERNGDPKANPSGGNRNEVKPTGGSAAIGAKPPVNEPRK